jgi:hypothetical protein
VEHLTSVLHDDCRIVSLEASPRGYRIPWFDGWCGGSLRPTFVFA